MKLFLDSSFIIGLILSNDDLHKKSVLLKEKGIFDNDCFISNLIINELITVIGNKTNKEIAKKAYHFLNDNCNIIDEYKIINFNDKVLDTYLEHNTHLSFTDSAIVEIMNEHNINSLVSFDKYFDKVENIERIH